MLISLTGRPRIGSPTARKAVANSATSWCGGTYCASKWISATRVVIAGDQAVEDFRQPQPRLAVDAAHDPEIDRGDAAVRQREQISLVQVGVEIAVDHRLAKEGPDQDRGQRLRVVTGGDQLRRDSTA